VYSIVRHRSPVTVCHWSLFDAQWDRSYSSLSLQSAVDASEEPALSSFIHQLLQSTYRPVLLLSLMSMFPDNKILKPAGPVRITQAYRMTRQPP